MQLQRGKKYFPHNIQISSHHWHSLGLGALSRLIAERGIPEIVFFRQLSLKLNRSRPEDSPTVHSGQLNLYATLQKFYRYLIDELAEESSPDILLGALNRCGTKPYDENVRHCLNTFVGIFPPVDVLFDVCNPRDWLQLGNAEELHIRTGLRELLLLRVAADNPAIDSFREILDDRRLIAKNSYYRKLVNSIDSVLSDGPQLNRLGMTLMEALRAPIKASPNSLAGQIGFIREQWGEMLPAELQDELTVAFDILLEEERERGWGGEPGPPPVMEFGKSSGFAHTDGSSVFGGYDYPEYEHFSSDVDWMPNVVLMAKMVYVWLTQLTTQYGFPITRLDQLPDAELDRLAASGFTGLWLIGLWERSPASQRIKQICGNPDAIASAYSLYDYEIAADLGGWEALANLSKRALKRGIRLASDMVPNHTGIYSRWVIQHPDWFVQTDYPPFPTYQFNGENLSQSEDAVIQVEDGYWTKTDAAVVFRYIERSTGRTRYIYHGNDGTSIPWNDTAQLNYLIPELREAVIQTILHVARNFPIIRFDAAMTLAKKHYQRLWFPVRGLGGGIPSRAEHGMSREEFDAVFPAEFWREVVDRVATEAPGTLLLAEAFWMMEGYFVRTLGMHRVYNSAFMNMLKTEENAKYRQTIKNVLEFNPEVLKRFVNFMNNPDEKTAVEQFGSQGKYFGACVLLSTMPGLPMFGHGQIEGFKEKYGMEYKRAYWNESVDTGLVRGHEMWIFPLLRRRSLFSGSENFALFDFHAGTSVDENVFAYTNKVGVQRAIVLYHNCHASTAGWIRESTSIAVKISDDKQELKRTILSSALGLSDEENVFYAFRDIFSNKEFLRNAGELSKKGLYAELGEYECHVFLDFREIRDDAEGNWGALCASLNGQGVERLNDELLQHRYASLNAAFKTALNSLPQASESVPLTVATSVKTVFAAASNRFHSILNATTKDLAIKEVDSGIEALEHLLRLSALLANKRTLATIPGKSADFQSTIFSSEGICLLMVLSLFRTKSIGTFEKFGLDYTLHNHLLSLNLIQPEMSASNYILLAQSLLALVTDSNNRSIIGKHRLLQIAFSLPASREFLLVHESERIFWFNKERFETLVKWLGITELFDTTVKLTSERALAKLLKSSEDSYTEILDLATHAGYKASLFLSLIDSHTKSAVSPDKKTGARKSDAKLAMQPDKTKTPDNKLPR